eukprot:8311559-Ditylum_brightwellii.AAC.1
MKEVGETGYTEYMCCLFKTYCTSADKQFRTSLTKQRRKWMIEKLLSGYNYSNWMDFARKTFNNQVALKEWNGSKEGNKGEKPTLK